MRRALRPLLVVALLAWTPGCKSREPPPATGLRILPGPATGDLATSVTEAARAAHGEGRALFVYVGATWCEPCRRFHKAVESGELGAALPGLSLLEFDLDRDRERLFAAGYTPRYIPLFAVPDAAGRGQAARWVEGAVKGEGALAEIVPKLRALLASAR